jgi:heptosyltransferase-1
VSAEPKKVLIVRLSAMGDIIHATPAVAALRAALPSLAIGWLVEERWVELLCTNAAARSGALTPARPLADQVHTVNTKRWRKSLFSAATRQSFFAAVAALKQERYDATIDFQGLLRSAIFARLSQAPVRYGFSHPRESATRWFYTSTVTAQGAHVIEQNLSLAEALANMPLKLAPAQFPRDEEAERKIENELAARRIIKFAILNPGAGWGAKQWPANRYGEVAKQLFASGMMTPLINFGPGEENLAHEVEAASQGVATSISLSLSELIALTRRASLFIGGDTGPMHLAAALNIPVVAIFGPTDPARNGPFGTRSIVLRSPASVTNHSRHGAPEVGLLQITSQQVASAARELLEVRA